MDHWGACRRCGTRRTRPGSGTCRCIRSSRGPRRAATWPNGGIPRPSCAGSGGRPPGGGCVPADLLVEPHVVRGETGPVLVDVADHPDDLLVIGTGRRGLTRRLRGSVGRYCLAHATCPVLAVPPSALVDEMSHGRRAWQLRRHALIPDTPGV